MNCAIASQFCHLNCLVAKVAIRAGGGFSIQDLSFAGHIRCNVERQTARKVANRF